MALFRRDCGKGVEVLGRDKITRSSHTPASSPPSTARSQVQTPRKIWELSLPNTPLARNHFIQVKLEDHELATDLPPLLTPPSQQRHT